MDVNQAFSDLRDIQQLIQDKYLKQFPDDENIDRLNFSKYLTAAVIPEGTMTMVQELMYSILV